MRFFDRQDAGRRLGEWLSALRSESPLVLGLPRGGVPVAAEIARALDAPLDVWIVRKVGAPSFPELGVGAVAQGGIVFLDEDMIARVGASHAQVRKLVRREAEEVARRVERFRGGRPPLRIEGRTVVLVDDGIATGGTMHAAVESLRAARPKRIVLAVPVAATQALERLSPLVDDVVCLHSTPALYAIGAWYEDFHQVPDDDVLRTLSDGEAPAAEAIDPLELVIEIPGGELGGTLGLPPSPRGLVLFVHGSGSSRYSPRNGHVAAALQRRGLATLLFDLLTAEEERIAGLRFDIGLLAHRLLQVTDWVTGHHETRGFPIGYFGSSTGAAAALVAASERPTLIEAIVSRGGRPDLAGDGLRRVHAPTLLIVGGDDRDVLELNRRADARLEAPHRLVVVPGATHLFEEPGALDAVARLAGEWFHAQLGRRRPDLRETANVEGAWPR